MYGLKVALASSVFLFALPCAWGANVEAKERAARRACLLGDIKTGTELLADPYLESVGILNAIFGPAVHHQETPI